MDVYSTELGIRLSFGKTSVFFFFFGGGFETPNPTLVHQCFVVHLNLTYTVVRTFMGSYILGRHDFVSSVLWTAEPFKTT
jgi:hypothetical protein